MENSSSPRAKPRWLILGGLGFLGRNLVKYIIDNNLASFVRIVDKKAPFMAFLSSDYKASILESQHVVECVQADVSDDDMLEKSFFSPPRDGCGPPLEAGSSLTWDYIINLAAETTLGKRDEFYSKAVDGAAKSGALALSLGDSLKKYVYVSTASVYKSSDSSANQESSATAPWTAVAEASLRAEAALTALSGLPLVILRPALVYGPGDFSSLMSRCVVAATYAREKAIADRRMELLWDGDLKLSTIHVFDVARAIVHCARKVQPGLTFNLADKANSNVGSVSSIIARIFNIEILFAGSIKSNLAALRLDAVVDAVNENHLGPWLAMNRELGVKNTPLSPYLHKSLLAFNHLSVDGSAIESTGFKYAVVEPTIELVRDPIAQHIAQGIFPNVITNE